MVLRSFGLKQILYFFREWFRLFHENAFHYNIWLRLEYVKNDTYTEEKVNPFYKW